MTQRTIVVAAVSLLGARLAFAANVPVTSVKLIVVDKLATAGKAKITYLSKDPAVNKGVEMEREQIDARFDIAYDDGGTAGAITVPGGSHNGWLTNDVGVARYSNKAAPGGPSHAKVVTLRDASILKVVGQGLGETPFDILTAGAPAGPVFTAFCVDNGGERTCHCSQFAACEWKFLAAGTGAKLVCRNGTGEPTCAARGCGFVDQGLTVLDTCTNLVWEKKDTAVGSGVDAGNLHDVDNRYSWAGRCSINTTSLCQPDAAAAATCAAHAGPIPPCGECPPGDGTCDVDPHDQGAVTTVWDWLNQINTAAFGGHVDWRLPTVSGCCDRPTGESGELESLLDVEQGLCGGGTGACIHSVFGPTPAGMFDRAWSALPIEGISCGFVLCPGIDNAWSNLINQPGQSFSDLDDPNSVRAVRTGP